MWPSNVSDSRTSTLPDEATQVQIFAHHVDIPESDVVYSFFEDVKAMPAHSVSLDHERKAVVLAIRGSATIFDCMLDAQGEYTDYEYIDWRTGEVQCLGQVHAGMLEGAQNINQNTRSTILELLKCHQGYKLIVTGHSLGGGITGILALIWSSDRDIVQNGFFAFPFASPPTVTQNLANLLKPFVTSMICGNDLVTRICIGTVRDLMEMCTYWKKLDDDNSPH